MKEKNKTVKKVIFTGFLAMCWLVLFASPKTQAAQNQAPGDSLITPELEEQINEYTLGNTSPSVFKEGAQEVLPFQANPYNKFNLTLGGKQLYQGGEKIEVQGTLGYASQAQPEFQKYLKDCQKLLGKSNQCLNSPVYTFPALENVGLFVQIWRKDKSENNTAFGDFLISEFFAFQNVNLKENITENFNLNWQLPAELKDGEYYLAFYVVSDKGFELWGSPLVPYSWAKVFDFSVKNNEEAIGSGIELDKDNIAINGKSYSYRQPAPEISPSDSGEIVVEMPLTNLSLQTKAVNLKFELYRFGQTDPGNLIVTKEETQNINMGEKTALKYSFSPSGTDSVYSLKVLARSDKGISQANVRFVVTGKDRGVFRFLGLAQNQNSSYPLFCVRDAAWNGLFQGKVKIVVTDNNGDTLGSFEQDANIRAETRCFVPSSIKLDKPTCSVIKGEILDKQGATVDKKEVAVSCDMPPEEGIASTIQDLGKGLSLPLEGRKGWVILFVIIAFAIGGGILYLNNKRKNDEK